MSNEKPIVHDLRILERSSMAWRCRMAEQGDKPAFPIPGTGFSIDAHGMTYREYVVAKVLAGLASEPCRVDEDAAFAVLAADALIAALAESDLDKGNDNRRDGRSLRQQFEARIADLEAENARLREALAFAACTIKSGEPWTETCEAKIGGALKEARGEAEGVSDA